MAKVLVIAPHPDDEVLGCGGSIVKHVRKSDNVFLCIVTKPYPPDWAEDEIRQRKDEVLSANKILGIVKTFFLDFPTVKLDTIPQKELNKAINDTIDIVNPEMIYLPHRFDINRDHQIVFDSALVALRPKPNSVVSKVLSYEILSETDWVAPFSQFAFIPNVYVDITDTLEVKLKAMSQYCSELKVYPHPRSPEAILALAQMRGASAGVNAAEAFTLIREIWM
jgi:LmbE family N-acetylglucosaminyl deacetylase